MAIEFWKIRREVFRFGSQARAIPEDVFNYLFATWHYDRKIAGQIERFDGHLPKSKRIAIFLIFPKSGLLDSHLHTLAYFRSKGYATLVVSNLPLCQTDKDILSENCWRFIQRPNFGYDFGGYRDGVLSLTEDLPHLERLVFINDSVWFPLPNSRDWLDDVEELQVDFAGAASNFGTPRPEVHAFRSLKWSYSTQHRDFHICSFAICLRPNVLQDENFLSFWRGLRLTDKKKRTVRRGEIGFTQWALRHSFSVGTTLDVTDLDHELAALGEARLREVAGDLIIPENPKLSQLWQDLTEDTKTSRQDLEKLILLAVSRQGASYALAAYSTREKGFPFLKKSPLTSGSESSDANLQVLNKCEIQKI